ncbi:MAG: hypothetical protein K0Q95_3105 [Bacteroidota bacterium]|jgi:hypothetical protein|nr:hypothetical protein [Bacteroidota bacterium]
METSIKTSVTSRFAKIYKSGTLLFFLLLTSAQQILAQDGGPSLSNVKKTLQLQEKAAHDEFMSYVYMVVGFAVVIAIAWISTINARKRSKAEAEAKMKIIQHNLANKKHHPESHGHAAHGHTLHKVRR